MRSPRASFIRVRCLQTTPMTGCSFSSPHLTHRSALKTLARRFNVRIPSTTNHPVFRLGPSLLDIRGSPCSGANRATAVGRLGRAVHDEPQAPRGQGDLPLALRLSVELGRTGCSATLGRTRVRTFHRAPASQALQSLQSRSLQRCWRSPVVWPSSPVCLSGQECQEASS